MTSDQPPEMDLSQLHQAQIVVPSGAEWHYLSRWGRKLADNQLVREDGLAIRYRIEGEALLSEDGTQLLGMLESAEGSSGFLKTLLKSFRALWKIWNMWIYCFCLSV